MYLWTGQDYRYPEFTGMQVRAATPEDWPVIQYQQKLHAGDLWEKVRFPLPSESLYLVADNGSGISSVLAIQFSDFGAQLFLCWNHSLTSAKGSMALMKHFTNCVPKDFPVFFWTLKTLDAGAKKTFKKWHFYPTETVDGFTKYERMWQ